MNCNDVTSPQMVVSLSSSFRGTEKNQVEIHYDETSPRYLYHLPKFTAKITGINQFALPFQMIHVRNIYLHDWVNFYGNCR